MLNIFDFTTYKDFLRASLPISGKARGGRSRLAEFLNCKLGFVSQVLSGSADFSIEHGILVSEFLQLAPGEQEFFLLLMQKDRAGSAKLRSFFQTKIDAILTQRTDAQSRIRKTTDISAAEKNIYYSRWSYNGVHMCTLVPHLRTPEKIAKYLSLPVNEVIEVLHDLEKFNLVERKNNEFVSSAKRLHLSEKSLPLKAHHSNWRMESIRSLDRKNPGQLHYSSVMSISAAAAAKIRKLILQLVEQSEPIISEAADEGVYVLTMDLFELGWTK